MDIATVSGSSVRLQSPSVTSIPTGSTVRNLQKQTTVPGDTLEVLNHVIDAMENERSLEMHYDKDIGRVIVQVVDGQTQQVVFQIPPEGLVNAMKSFRNYLKVTREGV